MSTAQDAAPDDATPDDAALDDGPRLLLDDGASRALPRAGKLLVGAAPGRAGLLVTGAGIEPVHCVITKEADGGWSIRDLGSAAGTHVNGERIEEIRLWTDDSIRLGARELRVVDPGLKQIVSGSAAEREAASPALPVLHVGGFRLERKLGSGGMGEVWLALQESLARPVALKLMSPRLAADAGFVQRFQEEARAAAALSHPNVVVVYDVGSVDGRHYLAMEYMAGGSLEDKVAREGPLPWSEAVRYLRDAALALVYAEQRGIVHQDVKPDNLMLGGAGTAKLADLGLATTIEAEAEISDGKKLFGTPHFMAPERARGAPADARADLYSLGATAYRLLTFRTVFEGKSTREILRAHLTVAPAPPSAHVPGIPRALDAIVLQLLAKEPEARPAGAAEVVRVLESLLEGGGSESGLRRRTKVALGVVLVLAAAAVALTLLGPDKPDVGAGGEVEEGGGQAAASSSPDGPPPLLSDEGFFAPETGTTPGAEEELEQRLRLRELEAQLALSAIPGALAGAERIAALEEIAARFPGTPTAGALGERIAALRAELDLAREREEAQRQARELARTALAQRLGWPPPEGAAWDVGATLRALLATLPAPAAPREPSTDDPGQPAEPGGDALGGATGAQLPVAGAAAVEDPALSAARLELGAAILARAATAIEAGLEGVRAALSEARFDAARADLEALLARLDLPQPPPDFAPAGWDECARRVQLVRERRATLEEEIARLDAALRERDASRLTQLVGPAGEARATLAAGRLDVLAQELAGFAAAAHHPGLEARARTLAALLTEAQAALADLARQHAAGEWRRSSVSFRRNGRDTQLDVVACVPEGFLARADGRDQLVPYASILDSPDLTTNLFRGRLSRPNTPQEDRHVIALLRVSGALRAAALAEQVLAPEGRAILSAREAAELRDALRPASQWLADARKGLEDPELAAALRREDEALALLTAGLVAVQEERWTEAASALARLLQTASDLLVVALLSDGSLVPEAAYAVPRPEETSPAAPSEDEAEDEAEQPGAEDGR